MMRYVEMGDVPTDVLIELSKKPFDWVLSHLQTETLFDTPAIALLFTLGKQAIEDELACREEEDSEVEAGVDCEPVIVPCENELGDADVDSALASLFGGVLDVSMEGSAVEEEIPATPPKQAAVPFDEF